MSGEQVCRQCGHCCERWGWGQKGRMEDLVPWIADGRTDILQHVSVYLDGHRRVSGTDLMMPDIPHITGVRYWQDRSGNPLRYCPFFGRAADGKAFCGIHDVRPWICREYAPWNCTNGDYQHVRCRACREMTP